MLNFNSLILFSENPSGLVNFYKKVLNKDPDWTGGEFVGFKVGAGEFMIGPHDKVHGRNNNPERIIFNFETEDVKGEYDRILKTGAKIVAAPYHPMEADKTWIATLADPDGNYFQLASPMETSS